MDPNAIANKDKHRKQKHQVIYERMHEIKNGVIADVKMEFKRDQIIAKQGSEKEGSDHRKSKGRSQKRNVFSAD